MPDSPENPRTSVDAIGADGTVPGNTGTAARSRVLGGRYRLLEHIADGGMAAVWRARDDVLARTVAVKILHEHLATDEAFRTRFRREAVAAARLTHPGIVGIYDIGSEDGVVWLVMELVEGTTLRRAMDDLGRMPVEQAAGIGERVARALGFAHQRGLVHGDVKPANILLGEDGSVKVADLGIAKAQEAPDDLTATGTVQGTAAYVAPEQILGEPVTGACDQYALGCMLFEALTGQRPFRAGSPLATAAHRLHAEALRPDLPGALAAVLARATARRPTDRYASTEDVADALAAFAGHDSGGPLAVPVAVADRPPEPPPTSPSAPGGRRRRLSPLSTVFLMAAALLSLTLAGLTAGQGWPDSGTATDGRTGLVLPVEVALFDPGGTGSEQRTAGDLPRLLDGDRSTGWQTVGYNTPAFGGLKPGVGFWLDLGARHAVHSIAVHTTTPGIRYEIRVADEAATTLEGWRPVGEQAGAGELSTVALRAPVVTRYVLVWVTGDLQADGSGRHRAGFSEVVVRGSEA